MVILPSDYKKNSRNNFPQKDRKPPWMMTPWAFKEKNLHHFHSFYRARCYHGISGPTWGWKNWWLGESNGYHSRCLGPSCLNASSGLFQCQHVCVRLCIYNTVCIYIYTFFVWCVCLQKVLQAVWSLKVCTSALIEDCCSFKFGLCLLSA